jgi:hypothetical protein
MFAECEVVSGFHAVERDALGAFVWSQGRFSLRVHRPARFAQLQLCYYGDAGTLAARSPDGHVDRVKLCDGWHTCVVKLGEIQQGDTIELHVDPALRVEGDSRELGVMIRDIELFDDPRRYETTAVSGGNARLNHQEYMQGRTVLESLPPQLRITMEVRCNIPETSQACVYCAWDWAKGAERGSPAFTFDTLEQLGEIYHCANEVVDCSYGEPAMHRDFGRIVAQFDSDGKQFSFTSNGQLLGAKRRREVLGKNAFLYVSLDSATAEGYARYRNDRFDDIIVNLRALCREKKSADNLPRVIVSFIVMRSNVDEIASFLALMRDIGVDEVKFRALYLDNNIQPVTLNNGSRFDYAEEVVPIETLTSLSPRIRQWAAEYELPTYVEWEQLPESVHVAGGPLCSEPWKTLYLLNRGVMPCCYATEPLATWDQQGGRSLETFLKDVFNSPEYQEIRAALAAGRLADFCLRTPSCPILKQMQQKGLVSGPLNPYQRRSLFSPADDEPRSLPWVPLEALHREKRRTA